MVTTAAVTAGCYDPVEVTVFDGATGQRTCRASVVARADDGSETRFPSCYHAALPRGAYTVRAEQAGYQTASTKLLVVDNSRCEPAVQTVELALNPVGQSAAPPVTLRPRAPGEPALKPGALPPPPSLTQPDATPPVDGVPPSTAPSAPQDGTPAQPVSPSVPAPPTGTFPPTGTAPPSGTTPPPASPPAVPAPPSAPPSAGTAPPPSPPSGAAPSAPPTTSAAPHRTAPIPPSQAPARAPSAAPPAPPPR